MNEKINNAKVCAGIAAIVGATSVSVVALIAVFLPERLPVAAWITGPLCLMGVALAHLATK